VPVPSPLDGVLFTGYIPSKVDARDVHYSLVSPDNVTVPDTYRFDKVYAPLPVYDQGHVPACVGYSEAGLKSAQEQVEFTRQIKFDGLAIYQPIASPAGGASIRDGLEEIRVTGTVGDDGGTYKVSAYAGVNPNNHDEVKHSLFTSGVLEMGFKVPRFFMQGGGKEFHVTDTGSDEDIVGGHAILAIGYDSDGVWLLNSWGQDWGDGGTVHDKYCDELWSVVNAANPDVLKKLVPIIEAQQIKGVDLNASST
jgi:hypothetical protein